MYISSRPSKKVEGDRKTIQEKKEEGLKLESII
jgi:hypothetical protein